MSNRPRDFNFGWTKEFVESLPKLIDPETGCWLYGGSIHRGYGEIKIDNVEYFVHRLSCSIYHNKSYTDYSWQACHKIECPNKHCFNPNHLYVGSQADNNRDTTKSGNHSNSQKDNCPKCGGPYTIKKIKNGINAGKTARFCKWCYNERRHEWRAERSQK